MFCRYKRINFRVVKLMKLKSQLQNTTGRIMATNLLKMEESQRPSLVLVGSERREAEGLYSAQTLRSRSQPQPGSWLHCKQLLYLY